jgi:hypothetical protein
MRDKLFIAVFDALELALECFACLIAILCIPFLLPFMAWNRAKRWCDARR